MRRLSLYLAMALLVGILALQNRQGLRLHMFFWTIPTVSVSLIVLGSTLLGALLGISFRIYDHAYRLARRGHVVPAPARPASIDEIHESSKCACGKERPTNEDE